MLKYNFFLINLSKVILIQNAVYNLLYKNLFFIYENLTLQLSDSLKEEINANFRITRIDIKSNNSYYYIEHVNTNQYLSIQSNSLNNLLLKLLLNEDKDLVSWNLIKTSNNKYIIQNKNHCYLKVIISNISCQYSLMKEATEFELIKIYEEIKDDIFNQELIEKEPIDALIKYIDLRDPFLKRNGIHQIKKDFDNEELKYCIRSIIKNIPWVRKIYILMPNEKVRFYKDYILIKHKIIYVKDKDILGFDSSNSLAFQFRLWKMKEFGISNNFIVFDDDYFVGQPLNKSNFFMSMKAKLLLL